MAKRNSGATRAKIEQAIKEGRGQGHYHDYLSWLPIRRHGSPANSNLNDRYVPQFDRNLDLLSENELDVARFILWLGVNDLREGYPCWSVPHPHPLFDNPNIGDQRFPHSLGTLHLARAMGIFHPVFPGGKMLHIPTIDLLATVCDHCRYRAVAIAIKPDETKCPLSENDLIKLALVEHYCRPLEIPFRIVSASLIPETLRSNLAIALPYSRALPDHMAAIEEEFIQRLNQLLSPSRTIQESIQTLMGVWTLGFDEAYSLFYRALWFRRTGIDLRHAIVMTEPPKLSNAAWLNVVRHYVLGEK